MRNQKLKFTDEQKVRIWDGEQSIENFDGKDYDQLHEWTTERFDICFYNRKDVTLEQFIDLMWIYLRPYFGSSGDTDMYFGKTKHDFNRNYIKYDILEEMKLVPPRVEMSGMMYETIWNEVGIEKLEGLRFDSEMMIKIVDQLIG